MDIKILGQFQNPLFDRFTSDFRRVSLANIFSALSITEVFLVCWQLFVLLSRRFSPPIIFFYYGNWDCLSSSEFLILLVWIWKYYIVVLFGMSYLWAFWIYWVLTCVGFLLLCTETFSCHLLFLRLLLTPWNSDYFALNLVGIRSTAASIWMIKKFLYSSFGVCLSDVLRRV